MSKHAYLSASASHRWINCTPSARLCEAYPDKTSSFAEEGTQCHELCAYLLETALGKVIKNPTSDFTFYNKEMQNCADEYRNFVLEELEKLKEYCIDPAIFVEQKVDFSKYVEKGFGTGDCIIIADEILHIIDYKHGLGVLVEATDNSQLFCYALGALELFDSLYDINTIKMTIFQPRRGNVDTYEISKKALLTWAEEVLAPAAKLAYEGKGDFKAGDHCMFCKAKETCRKRAEHNLELAKYDFEMPPTLEEIEIASILPKIDQLISWGNDIKDYALKSALSGTEYEGYKLVEGRSNRKYSNEDLVITKVTASGHDPYDKKLLGITAMTNLLGKSLFNELLGELIYKPPGKPALVPISDKRQPINTAKDDFKENMEE